MNYLKHSEYGRNVTNDWKIVVR